MKDRELDSHNIFTETALSFGLTSEGWGVFCARAPTYRLSKGGVRRVTIVHGDQGGDVAGHVTRELESA